MIDVVQNRPVNEQAPARGWARVAGRGSSLARWAFLCGLLVGGVAGWGQTTSTFQITGVQPATVPAGANGITLTLIGTLPTAQTQAQGTSVQTCFYTGFGDASPITQGLPTQQQGGYVPVAVPASVIQGIPPGNFTAANGYAVNAQVYFVPTGQPCTGSSDPSLTNSILVPIVEATLGTYAGPATIPVTNTAAGTPAPPPSSITLTGNNFVAGTTVTFGTFGSVPATVLTPTSLNAVVPTLLRSSPVGTAASLGVCVPGAGSTTYCSTPATPITLTVVAASTSTGTVTPTPDPVNVSGQTTLAAQFTEGDSVSGGAPSGLVSFTADGAAIPSAPLVLDRTATFAEQRSTLTVQSAATPVITPAAGTFTSSQTVTITDATPGAAIFYTQDGSTPTTASTPYTGPFTISATQTIQAIAAAAGVLNSAVASAAYTVTISPPTHLVFLVQPVTTPTSAAITPAVQVALEDVNGNVVANATNAVTMTIGADPGDTSLGGTTTVNAVNGIATFPDLSISTLADGYTLVASSVLAAGTPPATVTSSAFNITPYPITLALQSPLVGVGSTLTGTFTLGRPAGRLGVVVALASSAPANVTIAPGTVTVAAGQTIGSFTYTGVAAGAANLTASAPNFVTATAQVTGTTAQVSLGTIPPVAPGQQVSLALSLPMAAPPGGTTVTFTSSNTNVATVTGSVMVPAGQRTAAVNPQITGVIIGTTTIVASAPGFAPDTRAVNVTVVGTFNPASPLVNLSTSTNTTLNISAPAQTGGLTFTLTSDDTTKVRVAPTVTIAAGATSVQVPITGVADGSTLIRANSPGVTEVTANVTVSSALSFSPGSLITGVGLESGINVQLPVASPTPVTVTVRSNGPAIAKVAATITGAGGTTVAYPNVTSGGFLTALYVQGQSLGSTTLTVSAPGYTDGTVTVTVTPAGFVFNTGSFSTTSFSTPTAFSFYPAALDPSTLAVLTSNLAVNPGTTVSLSITSSATSVGTITTSPVVFHGGDSVLNTTFQPTGAGTTNLSLVAPAGFSTPAALQNHQITATVTAPALSFQPSGVATGVGIQSGINAFVTVAPPSARTFTVTSNAPGIALISTSPTVAGTPSISFPNVTTSGFSPTIYVQGISLGSTTLTVSGGSGSGYTDGTATVTVGPSGFVLNVGSFSTTSFSGPTAISFYPVALDPNTLAVVTSNLQLNPGTTVSVGITSSATSVGTITTSPVVFHGGDSVLSTTFQPTGAGTTNLSLTTPAGFSTPSAPQNHQITVTVTAPALSFQPGSVVTGVGLESGVNAFVSVAPPSARTFTVTSNAPGIALISTSPTVAGSSSISFPNVTTSGFLPTIYVQGISVGSTTLTVSGGSGSGYTDGTATVTVDPSGFVFNLSSFPTTTFSPVSSISFYPVALTPGTLTAATSNLQVSPGTAPVSVSITSSAPSIGTITTSPVVFHAGDSLLSTTFQPVAAGQTNLILNTPSGFSTSSTSANHQITATVTAPALSFSPGSVVTGVGLETGTNVSFPVNPPNPVRVTVTSNQPGIATISTSATVAGVPQLFFDNVTTQGVPPIFVQGISEGTTTLTVSAPGYTNGTATVTVDKSGFVFNLSNFSTTTTSSPTGISFYPVALTQGSLMVETSNLQVNPGTAPVSVTVTSSAPSVGTITTSPVIFHGGDSVLSTNFQPVAAGTTNLTLGQPAGFTTSSVLQNTQVTATVQ